MKATVLIALIGVAMLAVPAATPASQPSVSFSDLQPEPYLMPSRPDLALLLADPRQGAEFNTLLPSGFTTLSAELESFGS